MSQTTNNFFFTLPTTVAVLGSSRSGKTTLVSNLLENLEHVTDLCPEVEKFVLCYAHKQKLYEKMIKSVQNLYPDVEIQMYNYYPETELNTEGFFDVDSDKQSIFLIDDLSHQIGVSLDAIFRGKKNFPYFLNIFL